MNKGIPDCPDCGGKGMCDEHKREYLKWVYEVARDEYYSALEKQLTKFKERIDSELTIRKG